MDLKKIQGKGEAAFRWLDQHLLGVPSVLVRAADTFGLAFAPEAAGALAYFALFSLFPLLLLLTAIASIWLASSAAIEQIVGFIGDLFKIPTDQLEATLEQIVSTSSISGIIGLVGLIWSATGAFTSLARNVSRAWPDAGRVTVFQGRLMAVLMVGLIVLAQFFWVIATTLISLIARIDLPILDDFTQIKGWLTNFTINGISIGLFFVGFVGLYRWVPKTKVRWSEAIWGAIFATSATFLASRVYMWFLNSGLTNYEAIYGSVSTTLGLIVFFYINAWIVLFGAHLSSAVGYQYRLTKASQAVEITSLQTDPSSSDETESLPN